MLPLQPKVAPLQAEEESPIYPEAKVQGLLYMSDVQLSGKAATETSRVQELKSVTYYLAVQIMSVPYDFYDPRSICEINQQLDLRIPAIIMELEQFGEELQNGFSQKNISETETQATEYRNLLLEEKKLVEQDKGDIEFDKVKVVREFYCLDFVLKPEKLPGRVDYFTKLAMIDFKLCMVEQAHLIAESNQYKDCAFERTTPGQKHVVRLISDLTNLYEKMDSYPWQFVLQHSIENAAASVFSSEPQKMRAYMEERHISDDKLIFDVLDKNTKDALGRNDAQEYKLESIVEKPANLGYTNERQGCIVS